MIKKEKSNLDLQNKQSPSNANNSGLNKDKKYFVVRNTGNDDDLEDQLELQNSRSNINTGNSNQRSQQQKQGSKPQSIENTQNQQQIVQQNKPQSRKSDRNLPPRSQMSSRGSNLEQQKEMHSTQQLSGNAEQKDMHIVNEGRLELYEDEEEFIVCYRFPHLDFCACPVNCQISTKDVQFYEVLPNIYVGNFVSGLVLKKMLAKGITHVLNVTALEYRKRVKYFKYLNIDVYDKSDEDIKKHFRISNRFINDAINSGGKILIQDLEGKNIAPSFALAYFINNQKVPLKQGLELIKLKLPTIEISPNFFKQLERYDLEKLALVTLKKKEAE